MLSLRSHGGRGSGEGEVGKGEGGRGTADCQTRESCALASERARGGGVTQLVNHSEGGCRAHDSISKRLRETLFFEAVDEGEVGDASPWWWAGTVRVDHLANMSISRSLHRAGLRGTVDLHSSIRADRVFVPTPDLPSRAQELSAFASESHAGGSRRRGGGEEKKTGGLAETRSQQLWEVHSRGSHSRWCGHCSREVVVLV